MAQTEVKLDGQIPAASTVTFRAGGTFAALRHVDYRYLWAGTLFSSAGQWIQQVTLGWLVYTLTGSSVMLGLVNAMRAIPFLVTGPFAGAVADRVDRRKLMMVTQTFLMVATVTIGLLVITNHLEVWHLFVFTLLTGVAWTFNQPVRQALVANVVPREDLANAIALNSVGFNLTRVVGPGIGGILIALIGAGGNFLLQAAAYGGVLVMILKMRIPPTPQDARKESYLANMKEGTRWVWNDPVMRTLMALALIPVLFTFPYITLLPVFAEDVLHVGPVGLGAMLAADGAGAVLGALSTAAFKRSSRGKQQLVALVLLGISLIVFSHMPSLPLALLSLMFVGALQISYASTNQTLLQVRVPDELRGRVMSIYMLNLGLMPLGSFGAGFLTDLVGAPTAVTCMGLACITVTVAAALFLPGLAELD